MTDGTRKCIDIDAENTTSGKRRAARWLRKKETKYRKDTTNIASLLHPSLKREKKK